MAVGSSLRLKNEHSCPSLGFRCPFARGPVVPWTRGPVVPELVVPELVVRELVDRELHIGSKIFSALRADRIDH